MTTQTSSLHDDATAVLRQLVGRDDVTFRDGQLEAIEALVGGGRRVLVVQRTGWGKSAVYFVASRLQRAKGAGPALIVSPLLALMRDQIAAAERAGVRAVSMNSANAQEWDEVRGRLAAAWTSALAAAAAATHWPTCSALRPSRMEPRMMPIFMGVLSTGLPPARACCPP